MANDFKVYDLYATAFSVSGRPLVNGTGVILSGEAATPAYVTGISGSLQNQLNNTVFITGNQIISGIKTFSGGRPLVNGTGVILSGEAATPAYVTGISGSLQNQLNNTVFITGNQIISGIKTFSDPSIFNSTSITAPNQTISGASSFLTKGLADSLYGINYFSMTTGSSSGIDNNAIGQKVHSFSLPSGTYEFQCFAGLSGTVATGGQGIRFYLYPDNIYSFYGNSIRHSINLVALSTSSSATVATNSSSPFSLYNATNSSFYAMMVNGIFNINQTTEIPIYISQSLQTTGQPVYLMQGSYLKARKIN